MSEKRTVDGAQTLEDVRVQTVLPCPFCGGPATDAYACGEHWFLCPSCDASSGMRPSAESARAAWNRCVTLLVVFNLFEYEQTK